MALMAVLCAACAFSGVVVDGTSTTTVSTVPPSTTELTTTTTTIPLTTTTVPGPTLGLITPTGVPVAVTRSSGAGFTVTTPCGFSTILSQGIPISRTQVVLDPGHGGPVDTGAVGQNGLAEKTINLTVSRMTQDVLDSRGIRSVLTRTSDYASPLSVRVDFADALQAEVMVSIHHNAPTPGPSEEPGVEVFIQSGSEESARLGGLLWERTRTALGIFDVAWTEAEDAGVMTVMSTRGVDAYGIIRGPRATTALVELGYISNPPEADLFASPQYAPVAARAVADAIEDYLQTDNQGSGFVEGRVFNPSPGVGQEVCTDPALR